VIRETLEKHKDLEKQDKSFYTRLVKGTIERKITLDYIINNYSKTKVAKMKPYIRTILRMSVYQICYMSQIPDHAVCNEAVKLTIKKGYAGLKGFVNGVLRTIAREKDNLVFPDKQKEFEKYLQVQYSLPEWLANRMIAQFGKELAEKICKAQLEEEKVSVWCPKKNLEGEPLPYGLMGVYFEGEMSKLKDFLVQDVSSMIAGEVTSPKKDDFIVDVCAAPGGKSLHAAMALEGSGQVISCDLTEAKVQLIEENRKRLQINNLTTKVRDARQLCEELIGKADIVIADLPCSGLGIVGRKPEIKYRVNDEQIRELASLQREILEVVWQYVKPGGRLIYSTCTWSAEENEENYRWFLENHPFIEENLNPYLPTKLHCDTTKKGMLRLLPGVHKSNGFFISSMVRKAE
jgi:16S rRNA (cytosine967-C5)-methyltransferase